MLPCRSICQLCLVQTKHSKQLGIALNETVRQVTGCLKPTPIQRCIIQLVFRSTPKSCWESAMQKEWIKATCTEMHLLYSHQPLRSRLRLRNISLKTSAPPNNWPLQLALELWKMNKVLPSNWSQPHNCLQPGQEQPWPIWKSLNRLHARIGKSKKMGLPYRRYSV